MLRILKNVPLKGKITDKTAREYLDDCHIVVAAGEGVVLYLQPKGDLPGYRVVETGGKVHYCGVRRHAVALYNELLRKQEYLKT